MLQNSLPLLRDKSLEALKAIEKEWARAYADRDTVSLNCIFADEFQIASLDDFEVHYKREVLQFVVHFCQTALTVPWLRRLLLRYG